MESAFLYLNKAGFADKLKELVLIMGTPGKTPDLDSVPVIVGRYPSDHKHLGVWVGGCPPHGLRITHAICEALDIDKDRVHRVIKEMHTTDAM